MRQRVIVAGIGIVAAVLAAALTTAHATWEELEGAPPFGFGAVFRGTPRLNEEAELDVVLGGRYPSGTQAVARVHLPPGYELIRGDTLRVLKMTSHQVWTLTIKPRQIRTGEIIGLVEIRGPHFVDEGEFVLPVRFEGSTMTATHARQVRQERTVNGQRYRFGGMYLVPIDSAERVVEMDIDPVNGKPTVITEVEAVDSLGTTSRQVRFVAFVDANGELRDARPVRPSKADDQTYRAARRALASWRFSPATAKGKSVADWVIIDVKMVPAAERVR